MNIFSIDMCPIKSAQMQCDKHVVKMVVESAQMLSTAHRLLDGDMRIVKQYVNGSLPARWRNTKQWVLPDERDAVLYKAAHINHPCSIWTRETNNNYNWHFCHWAALCEEYTYRYGKVHKSWELLSNFLDKHPNNITIGWLKPRPFAIGEVSEEDYRNPVQAYRRFYMQKQTRFKMEWNKGRPVPEWFKYEFN